MINESDEAGLVLSQSKLSVLDKDYTVDNKLVISEESDSSDSSASQHEVKMQQDKQMPIQKVI